ncbi:pilus (MSHA type) biogenesis protein MshL [Polaromonas sp.]|uniref:pilus (MSHA type) biogenesis protein MshL n=1 Tax=Polaromonas sp. TaxID=1869339 RepID=UPI0027306619|nr:pilus (MSHA type) biogenesis protein MshL [Polaromonas sp.]MDP1742327.1 pilus (MSHA type) biogenesis protein MshL [Polaromonas sp.]
MKNRYPASRPALCLVAATLWLAGCATPPPPLLRGHLAEEPSAVPALADPGGNAVNIPPLSAGAPRLPAPRAVKPQETYSVVVSNVNAQTLLFALARDAKLNLDVHPGITGTVTLNALDQTIGELLDRIGRQIDMRYELEGKNLFVLPDAPFLRLYKADYPNITRDSVSNTGSESQVATTGQGSATGTGNSSSASIRNTSNNRFWVTLTENIRDLLRETDRVIDTTAPAAPAAAPAAAAPTIAGAAGAVARAVAGGSAPAATASAAVPASPAAPVPLYREAASVIANPETGVISVRATGKQHARVREFLDQVVGNARRQVLIEATIVEVALTNDYQQGINWSVVRNAVSTPLSLVMAGGGGRALSTGVNPPFLGTFTARRSYGNTDISATVRLLESFGKTRVLSSPKVSVMNNQAALLKVVDNKVYFTISVTPGTPASLGVPATAAVYTTTINTVPVGFLMNVTAQVGDDDEITLNLRPSVSRITSYANDPSPALAQAGITNRIPEIQTREFESIMKVRDGETAVLGGLMQDDQNNATDQIPGVGNVPLVGELFKLRSNQANKSELVIFLRPTILRDSSIDGDASFIRSQLSIGTPVPVGRRQ